MIARLLLLAALLGSPRSQAQAPASERWLKCNTHAHTASFALSDADAPPLEVARWYKLHGYQCLIITDHEHLTDVAPINAALADPDFLVLPGQEITQIVKDRTHAKGVRHAHVNGIGMSKPVFPLGFPKDFRWSNYSQPDASLYAAWDGGTMQDTYRRNVGEIHAQGAIAQVNHPNGDFSVLFEHVIDLEGPYLMEIWGPESASLGGVSDSGEIGISVEALWDELLSAGRVVWGVASDDSHHYHSFDQSRTSTPGKGWIVLRAPALSQAAVLSSLRKGAFYASNGVTIDRYEVSQQKMEIGVAVPLFWNKKSRVADRFRTEFVGRNGAILSVAHGTQPSYTFKGGETYVRAVITDSDGRKAWTQPVFRDRRKFSGAQE